WLSSNHGYWYVNNMTNNTLEVAIYKHSYEKEYVKKILLPKDSICVGTSGRLLGNRELPQFEDLLQYDSLYICDEKGNVLQKYLQENKDIEERSIFREEEWRFYEEFLGTVKTVSNGTLLLFDCIWVYDIREEDL
uniref:hypothetical protein n=1 Tax=Alistipes sp. TaxID=1872444 RepID=UPI004056D405